MRKALPSPQRGPGDSSDADAVSMHTTREDYEYDDLPELPSYSDSEATAATSSAKSARFGAQAVPVIPEDPYRPLEARHGGLQVSSNRVRNNDETSIRMEPRLSDPDELQKYLETYIGMVPPSPLCRIVGTHQETRYNASNKKNEKNRVTDFDISFNLQQYLTRDNHMWQTFVADNSDKVYRGTWLKKRAKGYKRDIEVGEQANPSLQDWCRDYCTSTSYLKVFRISRELHGLDTTNIRETVEGLVRSTHYHGNLDISFPIEEKNIDIYNPHWINRARTSWVRYIFHFTFLWLITWPILFFMTKWWTVFTVRWLWSRCEQNDAQGRAWKIFAAVSEQEWTREHANLIRSLVLERFKGDATPFPTNVPDERVELSMRGRTPSTGNANVDAAVNLVQGGVGLWNAARGRGDGDPRAWGADS